MAEEISLNEILKSKDIFLIPGENGVFFINIDPWYAPDSEKEWYSFSINPFDIGFMKFEYIGRIFKKSDMKLDNLKLLFKYLDLFPNTLNRNCKYIYNLFFDNYKTKAENKNYFGQYAIKYKIAVQHWLEVLFKYYDDTTIDNIEKYYKEYISMVNLIYSKYGAPIHRMIFNPSKTIKTLYELKKFVENYLINGKVHIRYVTDAIVSELYKDIKLTEQRIEREFENKQFEGFYYEE